MPRVASCLPNGRVHGPRNMLASLAPPAGNPPLTGAEAKMDANRNGLVERGEATGAIAERFALFDYNRDDVVSGSEIARGSVSDVHPPSTTFSDRHTVTLGGKRVTMIHLGTAHDDNSSVLHFPRGARRVQRGKPANKASTWRVDPTVGAWIDALALINSWLDFEHALTGHALAGTKRDAAGRVALPGRPSRLALPRASGRAAVLAEIQKTLTLDAYKGFERWDTTREVHIAAVYATLAGSRSRGPARTGTQ